MTSILINIQGTIIIYLLCGVLLKSNKIIKAVDMKFLSTFILDFILPINVFSACITSFTLESFKAGFISLLIAIIIEVCIYLATKIKWIKFTIEQMSIVKYGLLVSNGGLIGTPVIEGLYGSLGVMYANIFLIPTRILAYSAGESLFNPSMNKTIKDIMINIISNRVLLATIFGIILALLQIKLPIFLIQALTNISKCLSPLSLILVGSLLAVTTKLNWIIGIKVLFISFIRQFAIPLSIFVILIVFRIPKDITSIIVLLMGMPVGSTCAIFASKYGGDEGFASLSVFVSTITATFSLIILMQLIETFLC